MNGVFISFENIFYPKRAGMDLLAAVNLAREAGYQLMFFNGRLHIFTENDFITVECEVNTLTLKEK